jgi:hypothetical protein
VSFHGSSGPVVAAATSARTSASLGSFVEAGPESVMTRPRSLPHAAARWFSSSSVIVGSIARCASSSHARPGICSCSKKLRVISSAIS